MTKRIAILPTVLRSTLEVGQYRTFEAINRIFKDMVAIKMTELMSPRALKSYILFHKLVY